MDLIKFAETYKELELLSLEIMKVYDIGHYSLDGISIETENDNTLTFNINASIYYSGCGEETEWLSFELSEMNNDINYFIDKRKKSILKIKADKKAKELEDRKQKEKLKENNDIAEYKRLKLKYGK